MIVVRNLNGNIQLELTDDEAENLSHFIKGDGEEDADKVHEISHRIDFVLEE